MLCQYPFIEIAVSLTQKCPQEKGSAATLRCIDQLKEAFKEALVDGRRSVANSEPLPTKLILRVAPVQP